MVDSDIFELAPVAMWIEDFSAVKELFDIWRAEGVKDIRAFLAADLERVAECSSRIGVLRVNSKTLELFEASDSAQLTSNLANIFRDDMLENHIEELAAFWEGRSEFYGNTVNYTLSGRRLDIQLRISAMPGYEQSLRRLLVTTEDVTERETARRAEQESLRYAEGIFEHSPVSLWIEDFSEIRKQLDKLRAVGTDDLRAFLTAHPEFVQQCIASVKVVDVNRATLDLFGASDRRELLQNLSNIFRDEMVKLFEEQLINLWQGESVYNCEVVNYALDGSKRYVLRSFSVFPGHEDDWSRVQIAMTDITARKETEAHLEYLSKHDVLTKLHNRASHNEELRRLERDPPRQFSIIIIDLNGLKKVNDQLGHDAGDALLIRFGDVLNSLIVPPNHAARIGGDEFAIIMPDAGLQAANAMADNIQALVKIDNQFHTDVPLSISAGFAANIPGESVEALIRRADSCMYEYKRTYYALKEAKAKPARARGT